MQLQQAHTSSLTKDIIIWFGLVVFTLISFVIGHEQSLSAEYATMAILLVSFIKVRLIIRYFMEVKYAPKALKIAFDLWCLIVCAMLIFILLFSSAI